MSDRAAWFAHSTGRADRADWQPLAFARLLESELGGFTPRPGYE